MGKSVLTAQAVEKLKPDAGRRLELPDGIVPGLFLVIQPSGAKSWALRYRVGSGRAGKPKKMTLGQWPGLKLGDARDAARRALEKVKRGQDPAADSVPAEAVTTVAVAVERFVQAQASKGLRSSAEQGRVLRLHLVPALGARTLHSVERKDVYALLEAMRDARIEVEGPDGGVLQVPKYGPQVNRVLTACKRFFGWAVEAGEISENPAAEIRRMVVEAPRERSLSADELAAVILAADKDGYPLGPLVRFLVLTGARREEGTQARWREIDLEARVWTIPPDRAKAGREHRLPLSEAAVALLKSVPRWNEGDYVFSASAGKEPYAGWRKAAARLQERVAFKEEWVIHDLRRTVATRMGEDLNIEESIISRILAHSARSRLGVTSVYERSRREGPMLAAMEAWGALVTELVEKAVKVPA